MGDRGPLELPLHTLRSVGLCQPLFGYCVIIIIVRLAFDCILFFSYSADLQTIERKFRGKYVACQ